MFGRGEPEPIADIKHPQWTATLYDLLSAYAHAAPAERAAHVRFKPRTVWSLPERAKSLERLIGQAGDWGRLDEFLIAYLVEPAMRATVMASSFASALEMVREGAMRCTSMQAFAPIYLRKRDEAALAAVNSSVAMPRATE